MNNPLRPYKSDLRRIESLAKLGCNREDIASVVGVTATHLARWEESSTAVADLLREKVRPETTMAYADFAPNVEEAFTCGGKRYYRFKEEYEMPAGRYKYFFYFLKEMNMHASLETMEKYVVAFKNILNATNPKRGIQLGDLWKLVWNMETILKLDFDPALVKKLASVAYFDEGEDLITYDQEYGKAKIKFWEDHKIYDFFLMKPIGDLTGLSSLSVDSLEECLNQRMEILKELDSNLLTVLKENS
jgi:hypothetical protein